MDKKTLIREYKERKTPRGIFAMRCGATGGVWINSSPNLDAARNRLWFTLNLGNHPDAELQAAWNTHGEQAFEFEIVEKLKDDVSALAAGDLLAEKRQEWLKRLSAKQLWP